MEIFSDGEDKSLSDQINFSCQSFLQISTFSLNLFDFGGEKTKNGYRFEVKSACTYISEYDKFALLDILVSCEGSVRKAKRLILGDQTINDTEVPKKPKKRYQKIL